MTPSTTLRPGAVRLSLFALAIGGFGIGTTEFATMGVLPDIAADQHASIPAAGHLISLYALGVVVGAPLTAVLGARVSRKTLLIALMLAFAAANLASTVAPSFAALAVARFASGLPHGAYFGIGSVAAASLVGPKRRGHAVAMMMLGLTIANLVGVPFSTRLGQVWGWRATYLVVTAVALVAAGAIARWMPHVPAQGAGAIRRELGALRRPQVWLALLTGAVGFGGFFAFYSYIAPTMTQVSGLTSSQIWFVLAAFGLGMTVGNVVGGRFADRAVMTTLLCALLCVIAVLVGFVLVARHPVPAVLMVFLLGAAGAGMVPALQTRLMDVSADAQSLAAALNHSALNIANSLGAWLGGLVIAAGFGYVSTAWVGVALSTGGVVVALVSVWVERRTRFSFGGHAGGRPGRPTSPRDDLSSVADRTVPTGSRG